MRAGSVAVLIIVLIALAVAALMVVYVPVRLFALSAEGLLNVVAAGLLSALSIIAGAVVAFIAIVVGIPLLSFTGSGEAAAIRIKRRELEEKLTEYRARQRAMLEELDEVKKLLEEIRDLLKEGMGA